MSEFPPLPVHLRRNGFEPVEELAALRAEAPVSKIEVAPWGTPMPAWLITRHSDVREVLSDAGRFSNVGRPPPGSPEAKTGSLAPLIPGFLSMFDPPEHTRLRKMLTPAFTAKRLSRLRPRVEAIVEYCLDRMAAAGPPVDLVREFATPIPSLVVCELLGVPHEKGLEFLDIINRGINFQRTPEQRKDDLFESRARMAEIVTEQRRSPSDGVLGMLARDHGEELTDEELVGLASLLMLAGYDNTASMLGLGVLVLLENPEQLAMVRDEPAVVPAAVEELLRYLSVVHSPGSRWAVEDVVIAGQEIKAGDMIICSFSSANRDERVAEGLDEFDLQRAPMPHVALGYGVHHCLGAPLAKMELEIAFPALLRRFPSLRRNVPFGEVAFRAMTPGYGLESLPVVW